MTVEQLRLHGVDVDDSDAEPLAGPAVGRSARSTYRWSRTCPTPRRSWPRRLVTGGRVTVLDWPRATTQAGDALREIVTLMGGTAELDRRRA